MAMSAMSAMRALRPTLTAVPRSSASALRVHRVVAAAAPARRISGTAALRAEGESPGIPVWGQRPVEHEGDMTATTIWPTAGASSPEFRGNQSPLYGDKTLPMGDEFGRHRRLIYRSKQRGWLELDLLLGEFALFQLPEYSDGQLDLWEEILDVENPDLYKYLTLQLPSPAGLMENTVYAELLAWVEEKNLLTQR